MARQNSDLLSNQADGSWTQPGLPPCRIGLMLRLPGLLLVLSAQFLRSRRDLLLENLVLRQPLSVLRQRHPRPRLAASDRLFWAVLRQPWCGWKQVLILVQPETVRAGTNVWSADFPQGKNEVGGSVCANVYGLCWSDDCSGAYTPALSWTESLRLSSAGVCWGASCSPKSLSLCD